MTIPPPLEIADLRSQALILLEAVSGSRAYGLALPESDTDLKGVFFLPREQFYGLQYTPQVTNSTNDIVFYELGRFFELLAKNNPSLLELLATPAEHVRHRHPLMEQLSPEMFLSKLCKDTFAGYARAQIRKARGLNKKIVNPMPRKRKTILEFCHVIAGQGAIPLTTWLTKQGWRQEDCGLSNIPHARDLYAIFHAPGAGFSGIMRKEISNGVALSSIPKEQAPAGYLSFNKDGYQTYCKDYKSYWEWTEKRNAARYESTLSHGKNYDAKNMMHTFRLLDMAGEIARFGEIRVHREDRDFYLGIRAGEYAYDDLIEMANDRLAKIETWYGESALPEVPDVAAIEAVLVGIRGVVYGGG